MATVATGKPAVGGAIFRAPLTATLPTDATTSLGSSFVPLGYISDDGLTNSNSPSSDSVKDWSGSTVAELNTEKPDTFSFTLLEAINEEVLKTVYGDANVTGALSTGLTVKSNNSDNGYHVYVVEMLIGDAVKRVVIPKGKVTSVGDIVYRSDEVVGYQITVSAVQDASGNTHYEYIKGA